MNVRCVECEEPADMALWFDENDTPVPDGNWGNEECAMWLGYCQEHAPDLAVPITDDMIEVGGSDA
jgi:hypothetical protein